MPDHVHDWEISGGGMIVCRDHDDSFVVMGDDEMLRRLNATEQLSAEQTKPPWREPMPKPGDLMQEFIEGLNAEFKRRLQKKTRWGKDEVYQEYLQALAVAAIGTAASFVGAVEEVFADERVAD